MMNTFVFAAYRGDLDTVQKMLFEGCDPNSRDDNGNIAIVTAASRGHLPVVALLLRSGADPNQKFMSSSALGHAVSAHNADMLHLLLAHSKLKTFMVEDALIQAASLGYSDFVIVLLKTGMNPQWTITRW